MRDSLHLAEAPEPRALLLVLAYCAFLLFALTAPFTNAHALSLDLQGLVDDSNGQDRPEFNLGHFRGLLLNLTDLMVPLQTDGGNTSGALGIEAGLGWSMGLVSEGGDGWDHGTIDSQGEVALLNCSIRKGLPWAMELGAFFSNLGDSSLWAYGLEFEAAPVDGLAHIPDISIATGVSSATGTGDLSMLMAASRITVSKRFAPTPAIAMIPFAGFQPIFVRGTIQVLPVVGLKEEGDTKSTTISEQLPPPTVGWVSRGFAGVRTVLSPLTVSVVTSISNVGQRFGVEAGLSF